MVEVGFDVVKSEGLLALMKGSNVFATKRVFDWATRFFFGDLAEAMYSSHVKKGAALSIAEKSLASLFGGFMSTVTTLPLDVLVAKMQDAKKAGVQVSAWDLFQEELREKGWSGLRKSYMRGFEVRLLHVCTTTVGRSWLGPNRPSSGLLENKTSFLTLLIILCTMLSIDHTTAIKTGTPLVYDAIFGKNK
jgi:hypothetical protein